MSESLPRSLFAAEMLPTSVPSSEYRVSIAGTSSEAGTSRDDRLAVLLLDDERDDERLPVGPACEVVERCGVRV